MSERRSTRGNDASAATAPSPPVGPDEKLLPSPRVAGCTRFMQRRVAEQLPGILAQLLEKSKGDAATLKALWQMSKLDEQQGAPKKRRGSLAREMLRNG